MAVDKQTEPLVNNFQPASSVYGISSAELNDLNEVREHTADLHDSEEAELTC